MSRWKIKKCSFIMEKGRWFTDKSQHSFFPDRDKQTDQHYSNERDVHTIVVLIQRHSQIRSNVWECCIGFSDVLLKMMFLQNIDRPEAIIRKWVWARLTHWSRNTDAPLELWPEEEMCCVGFLWLTSLSKSYPVQPSF